MANKKNKKSKKKIMTKKQKVQNTFQFKDVIVIIIISILIGVLIGGTITYKKERVTVTNVPKELDEFIKTYNSISNSYYKKTDKKKLVNSAIKGMIESLDDPYSNYLEDKDANNFQEQISGEYVGIGTEITYKDGIATISKVYKSSPAEKAGLKKGDIFLEIDGKKIENKKLSEIKKLVRGKENSNVVIKVKRNDQEKEFKVKRKKVEYRTVSTKIIKSDNKKIGYIYISVFSANTYKQFQKKLIALEDKKIDSLIIDVRDNPGGHLDQVTSILNLFIGKKKVLYQIESNGKKYKVYSKTKECRKYNIVVLVNEASASASEILASSLKETYKAKLVGKNTYGKGTVQNAYELKTGATLKYTTQKWLTPKGKHIDKHGVKPDYEVDNEVDDEQLKKAIEILSSVKK